MFDFHLISRSSSSWGRLCIVISPILCPWTSSTLWSPLHFKQIQQRNTMNMTTIDRIVRAVCHPSQPSPRQMNKNPTFFLASIVENNEKSIIRKDSNDKLYGGIILQEVIYFLGYLLSPGNTSPLLQRWTLISVLIQIRETLQKWREKTCFYQPIYEFIRYRKLIRS